MSRLRDFGLDLAYYFGLGEGSERVRESAQDDEPWLPVALGVVLVPALTIFTIGHYSYPRPPETSGRTARCAAP